MATTALETRRGFLSGLLVAAGGATAAALSGMGSVGCSAAASASSASSERVSAEGATEILSLSPGIRYGNVMPDHVAHVRLVAAAPRAADWSTSKAFE